MCCSLILEDTKNNNKQSDTKQKQTPSFRHLLFITKYIDYEQPKAVVSHNLNLNDVD